MTKKDWMEKITSSHKFLGYPYRCDTIVDVKERGSQQSIIYITSMDFAIFGIFVHVIYSSAGLHGFFGPVVGDLAHICGQWHLFRGAWLFLSSFIWLTAVVCLMTLHSTDQWKILNLDLSEFVCKWYYRHWAEELYHPIRFADICDPTSRHTHDTWLSISHVRYIFTYQNECFHPKKSSGAHKNW